jgi:hypothetical protein
VESEIYNNTFQVKSTFLFQRALYAIPLAQPLVFPIVVNAIRTGRIVASAPSRLGAVCSVEDCSVIASPDAEWSAGGPDGVERVAARVGRLDG